ncbi:MAG: alpha/beta hydrolase [Anaerolineaceae bacterium]|nr:MAG: alpha/beta hydrolase [Anaerolineaceae bacterium]
MPKDFRPTKDLLGVEDVLDNKELARQASCAAYISKEVDLPNILLMHGATDGQVGIEHSRQLYNQLKEADKHVVFYEIKGVDHGGPVFWSEDILDIIDSFIQ